MVRSLLLAILLSTFGTTFASARIVHAWRSAKIETESNLILDVRVTDDDKGLDHLSVALNGKVAFVPQASVANLPFANLSTIEVEWGCGMASWHHPELDDSSEHKCQNISFKFDDSSETSPPWYESPTVIFTFSNGVFVERRVNRNISPGSWSEGIE
jgi:hypothetical protein